ncbi:unnamed protein product [Lampetra fluviatilis]
MPNPSTFRMEEKDSPGGLNPGLQNHKYRPSRSGRLFEARRREEGEREAEAAYGNVPDGGPKEASHFIRSERRGAWNRLPAATRRQVRTLQPAPPDLFRAPDFGFERLDGVTPGFRVRPKRVTEEGRPQGPRIPQSLEITVGLGSLEENGATCRPHPSCLQAAVVVSAGGGGGGQCRRWWWWWPAALAVFPKPAFVAAPILLCPASHHGRRRGGTVSIPVPTLTPPLRPGLVPVPSTPMSAPPCVPRCHARVDDGLEGGGGSDGGYGRSSPPTAKGVSQRPCGDPSTLAASSALDFGQP